VPLFLRTSYSVTRDARLDFLAGVVVGGKLKVMDRNGNDIAEDDYDAAPISGDQPCEPASSAMPTRRLLVALAAATLLGGCTTLNDRFWVPDQDPVLTFLGAEYAATARHWPPATLPSLAPMRTNSYRTVMARRGRCSVSMVGLVRYDQPTDWPPL